MDDPRTPSSDSNTNSTPQPKPVFTPEPVKPEPTKTVSAEPSTSTDSGTFPPPSSMSSGSASKGNKKKMLMGLVALVVLLALAGGGYLLLNKSDDNNTTNTSTTLTKKPIPLLRFASQNGMLDEFYPGSDSTSSVSSTAIVRSVFEGLVQYTSNGHYAPLLATSWTNPDDNTWVFKLQSGVKFHNGNTMTAQNVKDSLLADTPTSEALAFSSVVKSIDIVDATHVKITTKSPDALMLNRLVNMFVFDTTSKVANSPDNGTGPFTVKTGTKYSYDSIDLVQYDGYYGTKPLVKEIVGTAYDTDEDMVAAAKDNKIDVGFTYFENQVASIKAADPTDFKFVKVDSAGAYEVLPVVFKTGSPIQKKDVRLALYKTIDPDAVKKAAGKDGEAVGQVAPKTIPGYDSSIVRPKMDIAGAKKLLSDAGYPNGTTLSIFYGPPASDAVHEIGKELAQIGVTLTYHQVSTFDEYTTNIKTAKYDLAYISNYSDISEISDIIKTNLTKDGETGTYDNPEVDKLLVTASQQFDSAKRIATLQQASKLIMDDVGVIPIYSPESQVLMRADYNAPFDIQDGQFGTYLSKFYRQ